MSSQHALAPIGLLLISACAADPVAGSASTPLEGASAEGEPVALTAPERLDDDPFQYLLFEYDANGDGMIVAAEYERRQGQFERWDRDGDGRLTQADWDIAGESITTNIQELQKRRLLGRYFQLDEDDAVLSLDEFGEAFASYDTDGDLILLEAEFDARSEEMRRALPGDSSLMMQSYVRESNIWSKLLSGYDEDGSASLSIEEPGLFLETLPDGELRFDVDRCDGGEAGDHFAHIDLERGIPEGEPAPELSLPELHGTGRVELASFVDDRPVALIFGSYT